MENRNLARTRWIVVVLLGLVTLAGCGGVRTLPVVRSEYVAQRTQAIPEGAAPILHWHGARGQLMTLYGQQRVELDVRAFIPQDWKEPGDGIWVINARNAEGKPVPFLGVVHQYVNELGTKLSVIVPPLALERIPDGLYIVIVPNVETRDGAVVAVRPEAVLKEVRDGTLKVFAVRIPLLPANPSALTPMPEQPVIVEPEGTPVRID